jgi:hypothetical protein
VPPPECKWIFPNYMRTPATEHPEHGLSVMHCDRYVVLSEFKIVTGIVFVGRYTMLSQLVIASCLSPTFLGLEKAHEIKYNRVLASKRH